MNYPITQLCEVLQVSRSSYYAYCAGDSYAVSQEYKELSAQVREVFYENRKRYGGRRISETLKQQGLAIGRHKVRGMMEEQGLVAIQPKSFVPRRAGIRWVMPPTYWQKWGSQKPLTKSMWGTLLSCPLLMGNGST